MSFLKVRGNYSAGRARSHRGLGQLATHVPYALRDGDQAERCQHVHGPLQHREVPALSDVGEQQVEAALIAHEEVLEAAVIGVADEQDLIKPKAFVVLKPGIRGDDALAEALKAHVKARLAPYKYPRWIAFVDELPKTATGKIRRHVLREREGP